MHRVFRTVFFSSGLAFFIEMNVFFSDLQFLIQFSQMLLCGLHFKANE